MTWAALAPRVDAAIYPGGMEQAIRDGMAVFADGGAHTLSFDDFVPTAHLDILGAPYNKPTIHLTGAASGRAFRLPAAGGVGAQFAHCRFVGIGPRQIRDLVRAYQMASGAHIPFARFYECSFDNCGPFRWQQAGAWNGSFLDEFRFGHSTVAHAVEPLTIQAGAIVRARVENFTVTDVDRYAVRIRPHTKAAQDWCETLVVREGTIATVIATDTVNDGSNEGLRADGRNVEVYKVTVSDLKPIRFNAATGFWEQFVGCNGFYSKAKNLHAERVTLVDAGGVGDAMFVAKGGGQGNPEDGPDGNYTVVKNLDAIQTVARWPGMDKDDLALTACVLDTPRSRWVDIRTEGISDPALRTYPGAAYDRNGDLSRGEHVFERWIDVSPRRPASVATFNFRGHGGAGTGGDARYEISNSSTPSSLPVKVITPPVELVESGNSW